jgi:hypothetical protein
VKSLKIYLLIHFLIFINLKIKTPFKELIPLRNSAWASLALNYIIFQNGEILKKNSLKKTKESDRIFGNILIVKNAEHSNYLTNMYPRNYYGIHSTTYYS